MTAKGGSKSKNSNPHSSSFDDFCPQINIALDQLSPEEKIHKIYNHIKNHKKQMKR